MDHHVLVIGPRARLAQLPHPYRSHGCTGPARRGRWPGGAAQQALELPVAELGLAAGVSLAVHLGFGRMGRSEIEAPSLLVSLA